MTSTAADANPEMQALKATTGNIAQQGALFQKLYPAEYYAAFLKEGLRPDGRPPGRPRPVSISLGSITTADASALVKVGSATALACIKLQVMVPDESCPDKGQLQTTLVMTALSSPDIRPGRPSPVAQALNQQLDDVLRNVVDSRQLCISEAKAAWLAYLDIYILDADGGLYDVALLAAVAALQSLELPQVAVNNDGAVVPLAASEGAGAETAMTDTSNIAAEAQQQATARRRQLELREVPIGLTIGWHGATCVVDPSAAETKQLNSIVTVTLSADGDLLGMLKLGGTALRSMAEVQDCIAHARLRYKEAAQLLQDTLAAKSHDAKKAGVITNPMEE